MSTDTERNSTDGGASEKSYSVYAAGEIFTQHDLASNVFLKDSVWRLSNGKFELILPQSKELRDLDRPDIEAYIRNVDLVQIVESDLFIARFDGLELDAGTVVEFMFAKFLGKPAVILRCDSRRLDGNNLDDPYNLMVKNWPRTVEIQVDPLIKFVGGFAEEWNRLGSIDTFQTKIKAESVAVMKGFDEIARRLIQALEAALEMKSPYPDEYQEIMYKAMRYSPGSGFEELLSEEEVEDLVERLRKIGTL